MSSVLQRARQDQGRSDGGYIGIYTPKNQSTLNFLCGCFVSLQWLVNIYTHPNQIPGYASDYITVVCHLDVVVARGLCSEDPIRICNLEVRSQLRADQSNLAKLSHVMCHKAGMIIFVHILSGPATPKFGRAKKRSKKRRDFGQL